MRLAIEGRIQNVGAADIFLFMSQTQRNSVVAFERPDQETRVYFQDGHPVWGLSTKVQLQIESRLAMGGVHKLRDIELALAKQNAAADRVSQALLAEGMTSEVTLQRDLRALSVDVLRDVATWTSGVFTVYDGVMPPPFAPTVVPDFQALLLEALRGQCQKDALLKEFTSRKGILRARAVPRTSAGMNDTERAILTLVNGQRTVEEVVRKSGTEELQALGAIHVLNALHLIDVLPAQRTTKPEKAVPPPPAPAPAPGPSPQAFSPQGPPALPVSEDTNPLRPVAQSGDSTAKLRALPDPGPARPSKRTLSIVTEDRTEEVVLKAATFAIGRHPRNDLVLKDPRISSFHCRIELEGDRYALIDLKSRNGTLLNGARIDRAVLKPNDQIQLGSTKVSYLESV